MADPFIQRLAGSDLTIEQATDRTPDVKRFHVYQGDELVKSFTKLPDAQTEFRRLRDESDWKPPSRVELSPAEKLIRDRELLQRTAHMEYWSNAHKFRGGGKPRRK